MPTFGSLAALAASLLLPSAAFAASPAEDVRLFERMNCGSQRGKPVFLHALGRAFGHVDGVRDRQLFTIEVLNVRRCGPLPAAALAAGETGFRLTSREVLLYRDAQTGEVLKTWSNPYTGQTVDVLHAANDPVNGDYTAKLLFGGPSPPVRRMAGPGVVSFTYEINQFYDNPLGGKYQRYVGGQYSAIEMANLYASEHDLARLREGDHLPVHFSWGRISQWLPWMEMGGRDGYFYVHSAGHKYRSAAELPAGIRDYVSRHYPDYLEPPPLDDARPNESSWTIFKRAIDEQRRR